MKRKTDWADKAAKAMRQNVKLFANDGTPADSVFVHWMSGKLRAAERRGFKRAVKFLRDYHGPHYGDFYASADWLEAQERK